MAWKIDLSESARKQLAKLDRQTAKRITDFLEHRVASEADPRRLGVAMHGADRFWRYRVGDYRIICEIEDERMRILVVRLGNRREVYR